MVEATTDLGHTQEMAGKLALWSVLLSFSFTGQATFPLFSAQRLSPRKSSPTFGPVLSELK
jgi:hypothetical protein